MTGPIAVTTIAPVDLEALLLVLLAAWLSGALASRLGYPAVLGELLAGIILGPALLGVLASGEGLAAIGELGIVLMMLYVGTEIDLDDLRRASKAGLYAAAGGFVLPFVLGAGLLLIVRGDWIAAIFVGSAMGVTSLATKSRILADLRLFDTRIAYVLVAGALLSDTATLIIFAGVLSLAGGGLDVGTIAGVTAEAVAFFVVVWVLGRQVLPRLGARITRGASTDLGAALALFLGAGLAAAALAERFGLHPILGAFVAGMFCRTSVPSKVGREVAHLVERLSIRILAPVFFVMAGFAISLEAAVREWRLLLAAVVLATIGKIVGTAVAYLPTGHGWREGMVIGAAMNGRGAVEIIVAGIGLEAGLIDEEVFTVLVLMAIITTALVPVMLRAGVEWLRSRGELDSSSRRQHVTVIGAGPIGVAIARSLDDGVPVHLVDANRWRCEQARSLGLKVVHGDALDPDTLRQAHADEARTLIAITANVEVNLLAAQVAWEEWRVADIRLGITSDGTARSLALMDRIGAHPLVRDGVDIGYWEQLLATGRATVTTIAVTEQDPGELFARLSDGAAGLLPLVVARRAERLLFSTVTGLEAQDRITLVVPRSQDAEALLEGAARDVGLAGVGGGAARAGYP